MRAQVLQEGQDPTPRRGPGEAFATVQKFDPSLGIPCGTCGPCQTNLADEAQRGRHERNAGYEIIGNPTPCRRLVAFDKRESAARQREEQRRRAW